MSSIMKKWAVVAGMLILVQTTFAQRRERDKILDRKVFVVTMELQVEKERNKEDPFEEELSFRTNKMTSKEMRMSNMGGFQMGEYVVNEKKEVVGEEVFHFEAINKNAKDMSLKWEGKVFGNQIEGTAIVSKKGKIKEQYAFKGALKEKK
jgi:hypothetical protein